MISTKKKLLGATVNPTNGDGWEDDDGSESAELHKNKKGQYVAGTLFVILDWRPTRTVQSAIKRCPYVINYAGASHDLDTYSQEDLEKALSKGREIDWNVGDSKKHHCHVFLRTKQVRADTLAKALGIDVKFVRYLPKNRIYGMLCYLTHKGWEEKHQYQESDIWSNFDWIAERDGRKHMNEWDQIVSRIESGEVTENNAVRKLGLATYTKYKTKLTTAFEGYKKLHAHDRRIRTNIYIQAVQSGNGSGVGKSLLAEEWMQTLCEYLGWDYIFLGAGNDLFGEYTGQEAVIMDDRSFDSFSRDEFMALFDISAKGAMPSRFRDKAPWWYITAVTNINDFEDEIDKIKGLTADEDLTQIRRRFEFIIKVSQDEIQIYQYDDTTKRHAFKGKCANWILRNVKERERESGAVAKQGIMFIQGLAATIAKHRDEALEREARANAEWDCLTLEDKERLLAQARLLEKK